jgi:hypothetical protein
LNPPASIPSPADAAAAVAAGNKWEASGFKGPVTSSKQYFWPDLGCGWDVPVVIAPWLGLLEVSAAFDCICRHKPEASQA